MSDVIADQAAAARNHREFVGAVTELAEGWRQQSLITRPRKTRSMKLPWMLTFPEQ